MNVTVLAGGVGGARFLLGVRAALRGTDAVIRAVVNTGDDMWLAGLRITPDLDSIMYALAGVNDTERGWGRQGETERVSAELQAWGVGWPWFTLGDLDLGAHISRTAWLREGVPLSEVVRHLTARWPLGVDLIPATDDEVETHVITADGLRTIPMEEELYAYRGQTFCRPGDIIAGGVFQFTPSERDQRAIYAHYKQRRVEKQPAGYCCGSVFKNPDGHHAGRLIEDCGLKGTRHGGAIIKEAEAQTLHASRRKAVTISFARCAAERLSRNLDAQALAQTPNLVIPDVE